VFVHRDYHSRNLMRTTHDNPGILDFQDAVTGPITYDLVSLLRDCYIAWPETRVDAWVENYRKRAAAAGLDVGEPGTFRRWFDLMGVQRHLKASGIFARLYHRDGKPGYLADIPRTWNHIAALLDRHDELRPLAIVELGGLPRFQGFSALGSDAQLVDCDGDQHAHQQQHQDVVVGGELENTIHK
jgi:aminoglycoside/choline kinase family phosphotransferase